MKRLLCLLVFLPMVVWVQAQDTALKDRVDQLIEKLSAKDDTAKDAAEKALIALGVKALPLLPDVAKVKDAALKTRLEKIRSALVEDSEKAALTASKVTIQGSGIRLTEALKALQIQTGNRITDLREANGADVTNPSLDLDLKDVKFFEALDIIAKKAELALNFTTSDGTIGIMPGMADLPNQIGEDSPAVSEMVVYSGPFRIQFKTLAAVRDFAAGGANMNAQFDIAWEPRLRPMLLSLKASDINIVDDRGEKISPTVDNESGTVVLRPENPIADVNINMTAADRKSLEFASFKVKAEVTVPAGLRTFAFPKLDARDVVKKQGDIAVTLESSEVDEAVWKVRVILEMPGKGEAFESYRQGLFNNRIWLQKADGSRFEHNGGFSNTGADGGKLGFEYLFVDAPGKIGDYGLVYETPSRVLTIPLEFEFKKVPLP
jgi:hypothetical protein